MRTHDLLLPLLALLTLQATRARADDVMLGATPHGPVPLDSRTVALVEETVRLEVFPGFPGRTEYDCSLLFENHGEDDTLWMGFPEEAPRPGLRREGEGAIHYDDFRLHDFETLVDGAPVPSRTRVFARLTRRHVDILQVAPLVTRYQAHGVRIYSPPEAAAKDFFRWRTWSLSIASGQRQRVVHRYWVRNSRNGASDQWVGYVLRTGAKWLGPIRKATVIIHFNRVLPGSFSLVGTSSHGEPLIEPAGYRFGDETIEWHLTDIDPTQDIRVHWQDAMSDFAEYMDRKDPVERAYLRYARARKAERRGKTKEALSIYRRLVKTSQNRLVRGWARHRARRLTRR